MNIFNRKAVGVDRVAEEWIKIQNTNVASQLKELKLFSNIFNKIIEDKEIPDFWMKSRIILLCKENNSTPEIANTRPIAILPIITKAFEASFLCNLEEIAYSSKYILTNQRGFTPYKSTSQNLDDLFEFCKEVKRIRKYKKLSSTLIFINLKRAYDCVNINKQLFLLHSAN